MIENWSIYIYTLLLKYYSGITFVSSVIIVDKDIKILGFISFFKCFLKLLKHYFKLALKASEAS